MSDIINPWKVTGAKEVYDNNWINVTQFEVINPSGGAGIYGKVHFKNIAVGILVLDEWQHTYLVGQFRFVTDEYSWEIPEGGGSHSIAPLQSAMRELLEETGLVANNWKEILRMRLSNSVSDELAIIYLATELQQHTPCPEETEDLIVKKIPFEEALKMVHDGVITDAMSVAAILKVKLMMLAENL